MLQLSSTSAPHAPLCSPIQVWVKEWPTEEWLSSRKWCGSSWRAPCTRSWRSCWTPPRGPRERCAHSDSLSLSLSLSLRPSGCDLEGCGVAHKHWQNTKVTHTGAQCQWGFCLHSGTKSTRWSRRKFVHFFSLNRNINRAQLRSCTFVGVRPKLNSGVGSGHLWAHCSWSIKPEGWNPNCLQSCCCCEELAIDREGLEFPSV